MNKRPGNSHGVNKPGTSRRGRPGDYVTVSTVGGERVSAFVPESLPLSLPIDIDGDLRQVLDDALLVLGRLDGVSSLLPETSVFLYSYVRKEAVLSSQIEGTQSSLSDLLLSELDEALGVPLDDVQEVSSYVVALEHGLRRVRGGFPLSNRLIREIHEVLLRRGRGSDKMAGQFRRSQNWIGGTRPGNAVFVPPPPDRVANLMGNLELFLHDRPVRTPTLLKAAISHVQFETIHPFLDGNGRVGRLLIALILLDERVLREPLLYLSLYFKQHRLAYYERLSAVRLDGDWAGWLRFFGEAVIATARSAVETTHRLTSLFRDDLDRIQSSGRGAGSMTLVHWKLRERPLWNIQKLKAATKLSVPTVTRALEGLQRLGIVSEMTGRRRRRVYVYDKYLRALNEGTEQP